MGHLRSLSRIREIFRATMPSELYDPALRDSHYQGNIAKYLVDLHDANACFNFCGGMMFQGRGSLRFPNDFRGSMIVYF